MEIDVITLYPKMFLSPLAESILLRAQERGFLQIFFHQLRDYSTDKYHSVDHAPYGGGAGMVMRFDVLYRAWQAVQERAPEKAVHTIFLSAQGKPLVQRRVEELATCDAGKYSRLLLICGRFEGVDERFIEDCVDEEISVGDFVLSGGEIPALALIDAVTRLLPGVLGSEESLAYESFSAASGRLLEYPQYTYPREYRGREVPEVLLSGNHAKIEFWRKRASLQKTQENRPDLLSEISLNPGKDE